MLLSWLSRHKYIRLFFCFSIFILLVVFAPFIINTINKIDPPLDFFATDYTSSALLDYYGAVLTFVWDFCAWDYYGLSKSHCNEENRRSQQINS